MAEPEVTWTGLMRSTSGRVSKRTGQPMEYRVVLFSDGSAACTCPARIFSTTRGDNPAATCKHIEIAQRTQGQAVETPAPAPPRAPTAGPTKGTPAPTEPDAFLSEFEDDTLLDLPQVRHERRD